MVSETAALCIAKMRNGKRYLDFKKVGVDEQDVVDIAKELETNETMVEMYFGTSWLGDVGLKAICKALKLNSTLTKINLSCKPLEKNYGMIAEMLEKNTSLRQLVLRKCNVDDRGAVAIAKALEKNKSLRRLCLDNNLIGDAGFHAMATMLTVNKTITDLSFEFNHAVHDMVPMAQALLVNRTLTKLNLRGCRSLYDSKGYSVHNELIKAGIEPCVQTSTTVANATAFARAVKANPSLELNLENTGIIL